MRERVKNGLGTSLDFIRMIPEILIYQVITKFLLFIIVTLLKQNALLFLYRAGRSAFTSGDLPYLFKTKYGWLIAGVGLLALFIYTVFDINAMFLLADSVLNEKKKSWWIILKEAFVSLKYFTHPQGLFVTLYLSFLGPLIGTAVGFSFMIGFSAPNFVLRYISTNPWLRVLVLLGVLLYLAVAFIYIFTILNVIFKEEKINIAMKSSRKAVTENWTNYAWNLLMFFVKAAVFAVGLFVVFYFLPILFINVLPVPVAFARGWKIFFSMIFTVGSFLFMLLFCPFLAIRITMLYRNQPTIPTTEESSRVRLSKLWKRFFAISLAATLAFSVFGGIFFDDIFPISNETEIVAHRAGGNLSIENSLSGLKESIANNVSVAEVDIQRTKDGTYIICHDSDLKKTTGKAGNPTELTYAQIQNYRLKNRQRPWEEGERIPTLEEILDEAKGNIKLFLELKGESADSQMVHEVYAMLKERDMISDCTVICFDYEMIEYIEREHPDMETGYLVYFSFGNLEELNCDTYMVETECLSAGEINRIHAAGKKVAVWTVNTTSELNRWLLTDVDYVVTDEVLAARLLKKYIYNGADEERILQRFVM